MSPKHNVIASVNQSDGPLCVDIFRREDGSYGFEEYRRDPEDPRGWYPVGFHADHTFGSESEAWEAAVQNVAWLGATRG